MDYKWMGIISLSSCSHSILVSIMTWIDEQFAFMREAYSFYKRRKKSSFQRGCHFVDILEFVDEKTISLWVGNLTYRFSSTKKKKREKKGNRSIDHPVSIM